MLLSTLRKSSFVDIHTQTVISQAATALDQIIGFTKKCFNIRSTTDEHSFLFVLSLSRLFNNVLLCFIERLLSFKLIKCRNSRYFLCAVTLKRFVIWTSVTWYIDFKRGSISNAVKDNISLYIELWASQLCRCCLCSNSNITHELK